MHFAQTLKHVAVAQNIKSCRSRASAIDQSKHQAEGKMCSW